MFEFADILQSVKSACRQRSTFSMSEFSTSLCYKSFWLVCSLSNLGGTGGTQYFGSFPPLRSVPYPSPPPLLGPDPIPFPVLGELFLKTLHSEYYHL